MATLRAALRRHLAAPELLDGTPAERALVRPEAAEALGSKTSVFTCNGPDPPPPRPDATNPVAVYLLSLAPASRRTMAGALAVCAQLLGLASPLSAPWHRLSYAHTAALRAQLASRYAPSTANRLLAALRGVLRECRRLGLISADAERAAGDVAPVRGQRLPTGRALDQAEIAALMRACAADASPAGRRDAALIAVGYVGGLRRAELADLDLADYAPSSGALTIRAGKGNKDRRVFLNRPTRLLVDAWRAARGAAPGPLFLPISKAKRIMARRLRAQSVATILRARAAQAAIADCSPHDLRRSCISALLDDGEDLATVQRLAGHASPMTTARYDRRGDAALQRAADRLSLGE
jgi:integrase